MSSLWTSPYSLGRGANIRAKVSSMNVRGWSVVSDPSDLGPIVLTVPDQMW